MRYNTETESIEISAEELCALAVRRGDLDAPQGLPYEVEPDRELYYKLQSEAGAFYNTDVELSNTMSLGGLYFTVTAHPDGIIRTPVGPVVDKIKCVRGRGYLAPPDSFTLAMLKCSAYFFCVREDLTAVDCRVSYYDTDRKKLRYYTYRHSAAELREFYLFLLERVSYRAQLVYDRATLELPRAANEIFPYSELREGQENMIRECFSAIKHGKRIFVEAPTGTGKTISSLFPAIRALGRGYCDKIFYLTPKMSSRREAFSAAAKLNSNGNLQRTVMITAKEQVCPLAKNGGLCTRFGSSCSGAYCEYARGYYDRLDEALCELLQGYRGYSRGLICSVAEKYKLCPYELSLDLSELCDVIICDYNYAFDISVYFRRYFGAKARGRGEKYVFLIDETHNLTERAREMYSSTVKLSSFERFAENLRNSGEDTSREALLGMLSPVISAINGIKSLCKDDIIKDSEGNERGFYIACEPPEKLNRALSAFSKKSDAWLKKNGDSPFADSLISLQRDVAKYIAVLDWFDGNFRFYSEIYGGDITARIYCLDPSEIMDTLLSRAVSSVMFSATLTPTDYFCNILGGSKNSASLVVDSPFPPENLCVAVADYINTRFDARDGNAKRFATVIAASVTSRPGNYIAYFPSYACLEAAYKAFTAKYPRVETVVQKRHMTASERESFLAAFKEDEGHLRVGFCVLGGVFSEGVDLPGNRLIGSVIFGVGLPGLSNEKNIIKEHFDLKSDEGLGYDYAYTFPGMNNVLQAAGRVIRTHADRGVVVLADDRYATPKYRTLFPKHWQGVQYAGNASSLAEIIRRFWEKE